MFLSIIIALSFVFVSTKINQNININMKLDDYFLKDNKITNFINTISNWNLWDNENIEEETNIYTLNSWEVINYIFSGTTDFTWSIRIKEWWPIYYDVISYKYSDPTDELVTFSSKLLTDSTNQIFTWYLDPTYNNSKLTITNLWWYSLIYLDLNNNFTLTWTINNFKIIKNIWWKKVEKTFIKN
jgi:hypothetical protein